MVDIWREKITVRFGDVDRSDRLTLASIFSFFQEAAISHAAELGVGREALASARQAWVLSRFSLIVEHRPAYNETVEVSTWPRRSEKLFALRDNEIRDAAGTPVVRSRGSWLILDTEKRRPLRVESIMEALPHNDGIDAFSGSPAALNAREGMPKVTERTAGYSDIDYLGHMNNTRYIQWIQDATDADILTRADKIRLDINYLGEVKAGDTVELRTASLGAVPAETAASAAANASANAPGESDMVFAYEGIRPTDGHAVFRAEMRIGYETSKN